MTSDTDLVDLIEPVVVGMGYELWGVQFIPQGGHGVLRVYIDQEGGVNLDDCSRVSYQLSGLLDVEDPIAIPYELEVSSPGLDRPLFNRMQYQRYCGHRITVRTRKPIDGRRKFTGELLEVDQINLIIGYDGVRFALPMGDIESVRLVPQI